MSNTLRRFEGIARRAHKIDQSKAVDADAEKAFHPFDERNIHPDIAKVSRKLFDNGHYSQATFEAFKFLDKTVSCISGIQDSGYKLMMAAFSDTNPKIKLTNLSTASEVDEQKGYRYMFAGSVWAIRNPRGHEVSLADPIDMCLDHLSVASVLLRRVEGRVLPSGR
jgi:uncharacterized protein (TIGR02391 family)